MLRVPKLSCDEELLAQHISDYAIYQIDSGAQVIQMFDSWAGNLAPSGRSSTRWEFIEYRESL